jgi:hypothetical protein
MFLSLLSLGLGPAYCMHMDDILYCFFFRLLVLNFYPYLQKYIAPHQRDVTVILASLVMACHELVPPENLAPVLKQLVDQFVHDKCVDLAKQGCYMPHHAISSFSNKHCVFCAQTSPSYVLLPYQAWLVLHLCSKGPT